MAVGRWREAGSPRALEGWKWRRFQQGNVVQEKCLLLLEAMLPATPNTNFHDNDNAAGHSARSFLPATPDRAALSPRHARKSCWHTPTLGTDPCQLQVGTYWGCNFSAQTCIADERSSTKDLAVPNISRWIRCVVCS